MRRWLKRWRSRRRVPALVWAAWVLAGTTLCWTALAAGKSQPRDVHHAQAAHGVSASRESHADADAYGGHDAHGGHEIGEVNWLYGMISESDDPDEEPTLLVRPKGMPVPVAAMLVNTLVLFWLLAALGKKPLRQALRKRKERIMQGIDDAARMKKEASLRLAEYEAKLANIDDEIERIKKEMRAAAEADRERIVREAEERRKRMERDAQLLFEQELSAAREALRIQAAEYAVHAAEKLLRQRMDEATEQKQRTVYLEQIEKAVSDASWGGHS